MTFKASKALIFLFIVFYTILQGYPSNAQDKTDVESIYIGHALQTLFIGEYTTVLRTFEKLGILDVCPLDYTCRANIEMFEKLISELESHKSGKNLEIAKNSIQELSPEKVGPAKWLKKIKGLHLDWMPTEKEENVIFNLSDQMLKNFKDFHVYNRCDYSKILITNNQMKPDLHTNTEIYAYECTSPSSFSKSTSPEKVCSDSEDRTYMYHYTPYNLGCKSCHAENIIMSGDLKKKLSKYKVIIPDETWPYAALIIW